jgi:hypothetical protein
MPKTFEHGVISGRPGKVSEDPMGGCAAEAWRARAWRVTAARRARGAEANPPPPPPAGWPAPATRAAVTFPCARALGRHRLSAGFTHTFHSRFITPRRSRFNENSKIFIQFRYSQQHIRLYKTVKLHQ